MRERENCRHSRPAGARPAGGKNPIAGGLPDRQNATIRSPAASITSLRSGAVRRHRPFKALIRRDYLYYLCSETAALRPARPQRRLRSLRLSVRTPPFHGGESGSIPLGSAKQSIQYVTCRFRSIGCGNQIDVIVAPQRYAPRFVRFIRIAPYSLVSEMF